MSTYQSLPTLAGKAKIAAAVAGGPALNITHMAVGDGNGQLVTPLETQAALVHEVWRGAVTSVTRDPVHTNQVVVLATIPLEAGPFMVRELGLYDAAGTLIAVGSVPQVEKTALSQGSGQTLDLTFILVVDTAAQLTIILDAKPQADWDEEDTSSLAYIRNKPEIPGIPAGLVHEDRIIETRKGLTGGGDLSEDRIHDIDWRANIGAAAVINASDLWPVFQAQQGGVAADHRTITADQLRTWLLANLRTSPWDVILEEQQAAGIHAEASGAWAAAVLNTVERDALGVTLSGNRALLGIGVYIAEWMKFAINCRFAKTRLVAVAGGVTTVLGYSNTGWSDPIYETQTPLTGIVPFTLAAPAAIGLDMIVQTPNVSAAGWGYDFGDHSIETFATLKIKRIA